MATVLKPTPQATKASSITVSKRRGRDRDERSPANTYTYEMNRQFSTRPSSKRAWITTLTSSCSQGQAISFFSGGGQH